jgi:ketosteroid isomerase-like protein
MGTRTRTLIACLALASVWGCRQPASNAAADLEADREAVQRAGELWTNGYNARSADVVASVFTDDAWIMKPGADPITGRRAIQDDFFRTWEKDPLNVSSSVSELEIHGDVAWRIGRFEGRDSADTVVSRGAFIEIWRRTDGQWKIHRDIWTADLIVPTATSATAAPPTS